MKLSLFSSRGATPGVPNLVSLLHARLTDQPTTLVCPIGSDLSLTPLRAILRWQGESYVVGCDLIRPIRRKALYFVGEIDEKTSAQIIETFKRLLAR